MVYAYSSTCEVYNSGIAWIFIAHCHGTASLIYRLKIKKAWHLNALKNYWKNRVFWKIRCKMKFEKTCNSLSICHKWTHPSTCSCSTFMALLKVLMPFTLSWLHPSLRKGADFFLTNLEYFTVFFLTVYVFVRVWNECFFVFAFLALCYFEIKKHCKYFVSRRHRGPSWILFSVGSVWEAAAAAAAEGNGGFC